MYKFAKDLNRPCTYPMLKPIAFVLEPIPNRKQHCYGKDRHPMAAAHRLHSLNLYFVQQSKIRAEKQWMSQI